LTPKPKIVLDVAPYHQIHGHIAICVSKVGRNLLKEAAGLRGSHREVGDRDGLNLVTILSANVNAVVARPIGLFTRHFGKLSRGAGAMK
jgi:hypothetical protein